MVPNNAALDTLFVISLVNGLSPTQCLAVTWTNDDSFNKAQNTVNPIQYKPIQSNINQTTTILI